MRREPWATLVDVAFCIVITAGGVLLGLSVTVGCYEKGHCVPKYMRDAGGRP